MGKFDAVSTRIYYEFIAIFIAIGSCIEYVSVLGTWLLMTVMLVAMQL